MSDYLLNNEDPENEADDYGVPEPVCTGCGETIPRAAVVVLDSYDYCPDCAHEMRRELTDVEVTVALVLR